MKKFLFGLGAVSLVILFFIGCEEMAIPPDIYISWVSPLAYYVSDATISIDSIKVCVKSKNSVDSYLDAIQWEYYDQTNTQVGTISEPFHVYLPIPGKIDTGKADSAWIWGISIPIQQLITHMVANNQTSGSARLILTARSQYNNEETDTVSCYIGVYRAVLYNLSLYTEADSVPRNGTLGVFARIDSIGIGIAGQQVVFAVDAGCSLNPKVVSTDNTGYARTTLYAGSIPDTAAMITASNRIAGTKVKFIKVY
ncbi:MAG: hypothetical protein ABIL05_02640 [candidate division WOR-3 bacterium]